MMETNKYITESNMEKVRKKVYDEWKKVYDESLSEVEDLAYKLYSPKIDEAYQRGLNDAWDAARKIVHCALWGDYQSETEATSVCAQDIIDYYSAFEAIKKIRQYEQEKIKAGNEVNGKGGRGVITKISDDGDHFNVMWENGSTGYYMIGDFKKTGRNFPEIAEVLKKMQEVRE